MIHTIKNISPLNKSINDFFNAYKDNILVLTNLQWSNEDKSGSSLNQYKIMKYYSLLYLLIIVYNEIERTKNLNYSWTYYVNKFNLDNYRKCLSCSGIDIKKGYIAFGFNELIPDNGIELMEIEDNFIIGDSVPIINDLKIQDLLDLGNYCINNIN